MKSNIFIPKKINVGFQNRADTYTKKLAYIIYYDQKGELRKKNSWEGWRDKTIDTVVHENLPMSGFVLNKKVGDYGGWNHRQAYVRVYDPRDFEFEITVENLLYILENANSIKGKGLEGEFIYGWDGTELILIPLCSPDYKEITVYNEIIHGNNQIKVKDLIVGATYRTKQNEDYVYMGKLDKWVTKRSNYNYNCDYTYENVNKGKHHYFIREVTYKYDGSIYLDKLMLKSLGSKFISVVKDSCTEKFAELFSLLECDTNYSPLDKSKDKYIKYTLTEFIEKVKSETWHIEYYNSQREEIRLRIIRDVYTEYNISGLSYEVKTSSNLEEIYKITEPHYKNEYLENGKLHKEGK